MRLLFFVCFLGFWSISIPTDGGPTKGTATITSVTSQAISSSTEHNTMTVTVPSSTTTREEGKTVSTSGTDMTGDTLSSSAIPGVVTSPTTADLTSTTSMTSLGQRSITTASDQNESRAPTTQDSTKNKNSTAESNHEPTSSTINTTSVNPGTPTPGSTQHADTSVSTLLSNTTASVTVTRATNDSLQSKETILQNATTEGCSQNATAEGCSQNATAEGCSQNATAEGCSQNATAEGTQKHPPTGTQKPAIEGTRKPAIEGTRKPAIEGTRKTATEGTRKTAIEGSHKTASINSATTIQSQVYCVAESSGQETITLNGKMDCKTYKEKNGKLLGELLCPALAKQENLTGFTHCKILLSSVKESQDKLNIDISFKVDENKIHQVLNSMEERFSELNIKSLAHKAPINERQSATELKKLIAMVVTGSLLLLVFLAAIIYRCTQRKSQRKKDPYLTEEMRAVDNGCHDNPAMDFSERESEMQEKQPNSKANFFENTDSYIVPMDNLTKDELEEEDTHL